MKKLITLFLAVMATASFAWAGEANAKKSFTPYSQHYDYADFTGLVITNAFHVDFTFADEYSVDVTVPDFIKPYLKVTCLGNKVRIGLEKLPRDVQRKLEDLTSPLQATITAPRLLTISLSGAAKMIANGSQVLKDDSFYVELSGASAVESLVVSGNSTLDIDLSGASKADITADFNLANIDLSGASKLNLDGNSGKMNIDLSGASNAKISGDVLVTNIELSGSSKLNREGKTGTMKINQSGATKFEGTGDIANAEVELSGASKCRLTVTESLVYELSGASTLRVRNQGAKMSGEQSRGSKIDFER